MKTHVEFEFCRFPRKKKSDSIVEYKYHHTTNTIQIQILLNIDDVKF